MFPMSSTLGSGGGGGGSNLGSGGGVGAGGGGGSPAGSSVGGSTASTVRSRTMLSVNLDAAAMANDPLRELFEACKTGDIAKVKKLITAQTVNARDTAGRKSTPLHFAAGESFAVGSGRRVTF